MQTGETSPDAIYAAALKVFSKDELRTMSEPSMLSLGTLIERRLTKVGAQPPTLDELLGIKELVLEHLSHPALESLSKPL